MATWPLGVGYLCFISSNSGSFVPNEKKQDLKRLITMAPVIESWIMQLSWKRQGALTMKDGLGLIAVGVLGALLFGITGWRDTCALIRRWYTQVLVDG